MKTETTKAFFAQHGIVPMKGDLSQDTPEEVKNAVKDLLTELGNTAHAIPFYALFPIDGEPVVIGDAPLLQGTLIERLEQALGGGLKTATAVDTTGL